MVTFLFIVLLLLSVFLVMVVLLQRGRGGGLAGAFGSGGGSSSAFGTKTGDVFTIVTVVAFVLYMLLSIALFMKIKWSSTPDQLPGRAKISADAQDAEDVTETSLKLIWKDESSNRLGYRIYRSENGTSYPTVPTGQVPANQHFFVDTGLTPGTSYFYQVEAWNNAGKASNPLEQPFRATTKGVKPPFNPVVETQTSQPATTSRPATGSQPATGSAPATTSASAPANAAPPASATAPAASATAPAPTTPPATTPKP